MDKDPTMVKHKGNIGKTLSLNFWYHVWECFLQLINFMEEVEVCVSSLSFCQLITFNKWDNQTKLYDWGYSCEETKNGYNNKSYKYSCRISMCFSKVTFSLGIICCKMV